MKIIYISIIMIPLFSEIIPKQKIILENLENRSNVYIDTTFHFEINYYPNYVDSKSGIFTRRYEKRIKKVSFKLTSEEIETLKSIFEKEGLEKLPDIYEPDCPVSILPTFTEKYTVYYKDIVKKFNYDVNYKCYEEKDILYIKKIKVFRDAIMNILLSRKEIRDLEPSDIIFI